MAFIYLNFSFNSQHLHEFHFNCSNKAGRASKEVSISLIIREKWMVQLPGYGDPISVFSVTRHALSIRHVRLSITSYTTIQSLVREKCTQNLSANMIRRLRKTRFVQPSVAQSNICSSSKQLGTWHMWLYIALHIQLVNTQ